MRGRKKNPLKVTSFRLPDEMLAFLKARAVAADRTMSYILLEILTLYKNFEEGKAKAPKKPTKEAT